MSLAILFSIYLELVESSVIVGALVVMMGNNNLDNGEECDDVGIGAAGNKGPTTCGILVTKLVSFFSFLPSASPHICNLALSSFWLCWSSLWLNENDQLFVS